MLATQTMVQRKPKRFRVFFEGTAPQGVTAKDMILHLIGDVGTAAGTGHAVEYAGSAVRALSVEARLTLCNLSIEMGARTGMVAPDDTTYGFLEGRDYAPKGATWDRAVAYWRTLPSDPDAEFDREHTIDMAKVVLLHTQDRRIRNLAQSIITEQQYEINLMNGLLNAPVGTSETAQ